MECTADFSHYRECALIRDGLLEEERFLVECELNVDIVASKLSMYSSYSKNLGQRRQREPTECGSMRDYVLILLVKESSMACNLRPYG